MKGYSLLYLTAVLTYLQPVSLLAFGETGPSIQCSEPIWTPERVSGVLYSFSVERQCTIAELPSENLTALRDFYVQDRQAEAQEVHSVTPIQNGTKLDVTDFLHTKHGDMTIRSDVSLTVANGSSFLYRSLSTSVQAKGDAKYTQSADFIFQVEPLPHSFDSSAVHIRYMKEAIIKKPGIATVGMFIREARKGLAEELDRLLDEHNQKIATHL